MWDGDGEESLILDDFKSDPDVLTIPHQISTVNLDIIVIFYFQSLTEEYFTLLHAYKFEWLAMKTYTMKQNITDQN